MFNSLRFLSLVLFTAIFMVAATPTYQIEFKVQEGVNLNEIIASWNVSSLDGIVQFELERKMNNGNWSVIHRREITPVDLTSGKKDFTYEDRDVYKSSETAAIAEYKLRVIHSDRTTRELHAQVQYNTSAVRRTWGSIKSMFQ